MRLCLTFTCITLLACGKPDADSATADTTSPSTSTTADTEGDPDTSAGTTVQPTTGEPPSTTGDLTTTTDDPSTTVTVTTVDPSTTSATTTDTGDTTTGDTTTGGPVEFERFLLSNAAGPCPPMADCDGFIELLADGLLRVEPFGEVGNPVTEVQIDMADLDAAVPVFTDPALLALLDGPDPVCDPPTDVFESMLVVIAGADHDAATTFCMQPPVAAARDMANMLRDKYAP